MADISTATRPKTPADYLPADPSGIVSTANAAADQTAPSVTPDMWKRAAAAAAAPEIDKAGAARLNRILQQEQSLVSQPAPTTPEVPKAPTETQAPDYKPRNILKAMSNPIILAAFALAAFASKDHVRGLAQAITGYVNGFQEADKATMEQQRQNWLDQNQKLQDDFKMRSEAYRNALEANSANIAAQQAKFSELANQFGDTKAALAAQHPNSGVMWEYLNKMDEIHSRLAEQYLRVLTLGSARKTPQETMLDDWEKINPMPADPRKRADWYSRKAAAYKDIEVNSRLTPANMGESGTQFNPVPVQNQGEADKLDRDTWFLWPDGNIYKKQ